MDPVQFFKCLADSTRLKTLMLIQLEKELCVCELMAALNDSQPKISRHLAQLKQCGLLLDRKQSQWVYYRLNPQLSPWMLQVISNATSDNTNFIMENRQKLGLMSNRPDNCCVY